jgi:hypothetical protein
MIITTNDSNHSALQVLQQQEECPSSSRALVVPLRTHLTHLYLAANFGPMLNMV